MTVAHGALACLMMLDGTAARSAAHTPAPGSGERRAITQALRRVGDLPARVFVIRQLRVEGGWAWIVADPQSRDGTQRYETQSALLLRQGRFWTIVDQPCAEDGCDERRERARIGHAHPAMPAELLDP